MPLRCPNHRLLFALLLLPLLAPAQARLNLALEPTANHGQPLVLWSRQVFAGTTLAFDMVTFRQERGSLRLALEPTDKADDPAYAALYTLFSFPVDSVRGRLITVSAWLFQQQRFRDIDVQETPRNFVPHELRSEFDAVLFQQTSTAAQHL